jgi:hypothetical protein
MGFEHARPAAAVLTDFRRRPVFPLSFASRRSLDRARVRRFLTATRRATETFITILIVIGIPLRLDRRGDHPRRRHLDRHPAAPGRPAQDIARGYDPFVATASINHERTSGRP